MQPYELFIGLRYTRAKRRNHFISFISLISMLGMALGVMTLIVVLSLMNGFQKEIRARMLGASPHLELHSGLRSAGLETHNVAFHQPRLMLVCASFLGLLHCR